MRNRIIGGKISIIASDLMAVTMIDKIEEFNRTKENWQQYVERLGFFFVANGIDTAEKKQSVFLFVRSFAT